MQIVKETTGNLKWRFRVCWLRKRKHNISVIHILCNKNRSKKKKKWVEDYKGNSYTEFANNLLILFHNNFKGSQMQIKFAPHCASVECIVCLEIHCTCERYCCLLIRPKWFSFCVFNRPLIMLKSITLFKVATT